MSDDVGRAAVRAGDQGRGRRAAGCRRRRQRTGRQGRPGVSRATKCCCSDYNYVHICVAWKLARAWRKRYTRLQGTGRCFRGPCAWPGTPRPSLVGPWLATTSYPPAHSHTRPAHSRAQGVWLSSGCLICFACVGPAPYAHASTQLEGCTRNLISMMHDLGGGVGEGVGGSRRSALLGARRVGVGVSGRAWRLRYDWDQAAGASYVPR
jgi:hypothetical protein